MTALRKLASSWLVVIVTAAVACSSPSVPSFGGDDAAGGQDAGRDPSGDDSGPVGPPGSAIDAGTELDAGPAIDAGAGTPPDASTPGDLETMCGSVPTTPEAWERCRVKRFCESHVHCSEQNLYADVDECIALSDALSGGQIASDTFEAARAVAAGRAAIDVVQFTQCLDDLSPARCSTAGTAASCQRRYDGTIADQQACFSDAECRSPGASCAPRDCGDACCAGTCQPRARLGAHCADFNACEPGLVCSVTSQKCVTGDVGSACGRYDCDSGDWCNKGICQPDLAEGAACDSVLQCDGETACVGLQRPVEPPRCRHATSVGDVCDWFCLGNLYCDLSNPQGFGTCRPLPRDGAPCSAQLPCVGQNDRCSSQGICIARATVGQPCSDGTCAPGLFCTDQLGATPAVCRAPFADGEAGCKQAAQCASHLCTGDQTNAGHCVATQSMCP